MDQSRLSSLYETLINTAIGLLINLAANVLVFPHFGFHPTAGQNVQLTLIYTGISIARQYCLRRWFNARLRTIARQLAGLA